jgi:hypothetical protein
MVDWNASLGQRELDDIPLPEAGLCEAVTEYLGLLEHVAYDRP